MEWIDLLKRAESGEDEAQYNIGMAYHDGVCNRTDSKVEQNFHKAFEWFNRSYRNGNLDAMVVIADYLSDGIAGEKDVEKAIELYQEAIAKGSSIAANNLATVYRDKGEFVKAFDHYKFAEKLSDINYSLPVGLCYFYGVGVAENKSKASGIFKLISEDKQNRCSGYEVYEANFMLGQMYLQGSGVERSFEKARQFLELADTDDDHRSAQDILKIIGRNKS